MICCEKCDAWQHNECMEMSENDAELPEEYYCEQCRPKDHKSLLAKIARGEKPWEERAKQRDLEEQEKKGRKRGKGKKGKKGRPSEVPKPETHENGAMDVDPVPALEEQLTKIGEPPQEEKAETSKRKLPEEISQEPQSPSQIVSALPQKWPQISANRLSGASQQIS